MKHPSDTEGNYYSNIRIAVLVFCIGAIVLTACRQKQILLTTAELEMRSPFSATVETVYVHEKPSGNVVAINLKSSNGEKLSFGGPSVGQDVVAFARTLKNGESYEFPKTWLDYKAKAE
jgi:hypothetical protein